MNRSRKREKGKAPVREQLCNGKRELGPVDIFLLWCLFRDLRLVFAPTASGWTCAVSMGCISVPKTRRGLPWRRLFLERRSVVAACPGSTVRTTAWVKVDSYMTFDYTFFNIALSAADALPPDLIALRYYWCCRCPRREVWWHVRIEMIYVIHRSWSVRRIYKYVVNLRQLWVCYNERQLAVRYYSIVDTQFTIVYP